MWVQAKFLGIVAVIFLSDISIAVSKPNQGKPWMISYRQPWAWALSRGLVTCMTHDERTRLPQKDELVFIHVPRSSWPRWKYLSWSERVPPISQLPASGVIGMAHVADVGRELPPEEITFWDMQTRFRVVNVAKPRKLRLRDLVLFDHMITATGKPNPTQEVPQAVLDYYAQHFSNGH